MCAPVETGSTWMRMFPSSCTCKRWSSWSEFPWTPGSGRTGSENTTKGAPTVGQGTVMRVEPVISKPWKPIQRVGPADVCSFSLRKLERWHLGVCQPLCGLVHPHPETPLGGSHCAVVGSQGGLDPIPQAYRTVLPHLPLDL